MGKKGGSSPRTPDPVVTANAQAAANVDTARVTAALNRYNQQTPYGNYNWTNNGNDQWTSSIKLDPRVQQLLDTQLKAQNTLSGAVDNAATRAAQTFGQGMDTSGLPAAPNVSQLQGDINSRFTDPTQAIGSASDLYGRSTGAMGNVLGNLQNMQALNYGQAPGMPQTDAAARQSVEDALYSRQTRNLDPQYTQRESDMKSQLAAQGITEGSAAYQREMDNFSRTRNDAYDQARTSAITGADTALQNQFNRELTARQQGVTEANTLHNSTLQDALIGSNVNSTLGGDYSKLLGVESSQEGQKSNTLASEFNTNTNSRSNQLNEMSALRQQVLNELNALQTGTQATQPSFAGENTSVNVDTTPLAQSIYNSYQGQLNSYNAAQSGQNSLFGGLASLGGMAAMGYFMSDRRMKTDIQRLDASLAGLPLYRFKYRHDGMPAIGVMAQEVEQLYPHAVAELGGIKLVNYAYLREVENGRI